MLIIFQDEPNSYQRILGIRGRDIKKQWVRHSWIFRSWLEKSAFDLKLRKFCLLLKKSEFKDLTNIFLKSVPKLKGSTSS